MKLYIYIIYYIYIQELMAVHIIVDNGMDVAK